MKRKTPRSRIGRLVAGTTASLLLTMATNLWADSEKFTIDIESKLVGSALLDLAEQSGVQIVLPREASRQITARALKGEYTLIEALNLMLAGTGLEYEFTSDDSVLVKAAAKKKSEAMRESRMNDFLFEEIVVTAQKREQRLIEVPISVAALSGKQMAEAGITDLQSLSFAVPGLLVAESGSFQRRISIRGIGNVFGSSSLVGVYLDEASVASLPSYQIDLRIHDIERVEVLKGPQGTLYGEGSVGGTIRYLTKDPQLDSFTGNISMDLSSTRTGDLSQELKSVLNIPLAKRLGIRVAGQYINAGGWIDQPTLGKNDINSYKMFNIRTKLLWQPTDNLEIKSTAIVHRNNAGAQNTTDSNGDYHQTFSDPSTPSSKDDYDFYSLFAAYDIGHLNLVSSTSYLDSDRKSINHGERCCAVDPDQQSQAFAPELQIEAEILTQELRISIDGSDSWNWTAGVFYKDAVYHPLTIRGTAFAGVPGGTLGVNLFEISDVFQEENSKSWAIFGETSYAITEYLEIGTGLRYFEDDREFQSFRNGPFQKGTFDAFNPKFYLSYGVTEDIHVYANAAKGFRSGGFNAANQPSFDPENVWSYEVGSKMSLLDGRLNTEVAFYYSEYDDYQIIGLIPGVLGQITSNAGNAEIQGIEVSLRFFATIQFEMGFNGNYMDTEFVEINATSSTHEVGDPLDLVPEYGYTLWGNYSFTWFSNSPGYMRLDYSRQGKSNYRNRTYGPNYHSTSDTMDMLNTRVGWESGNLSLELYALNLLDEDGFASPFAIEEAASRPRPRTIGLNFNIKF